MPDSSHCPECGAELPFDAPHGLCPRCLAEAAIAPGARVQYFGDYELLEEIALGGMGVVWKARQTSLNRTVALKMIRGGFLASAEDLARFRAEAEAAANLQHPRIVAIHEIGEYDGQQYFSMDYVDGKNLAELCDGRPLPARQAAELLVKIAEAVQFAHQRGILHRDLKPQNVMMGSDGEPRLTDFGLAKRLDTSSALTQTGAILGSPSYMAPEQAQGRADRVGPHTDVYALGAILYEMLTGRAPFGGEGPTETILQVISDPPSPPSHHNPQVARDLETICLKCLEKEPARRYATARELGEELGRYLRDEPIFARPASHWRKAQSWVRRHPWTMLAVASFVVFGLAFCTYFLVEQNSFLRAQQRTPGLARVKGPRSAQIETWMTFVLLMFSAVAFTRLAVLKKIGGHRPYFFGNPFIPRPDIHPRWITFCGWVGAAAAIYGLFFLGKLIEAYVWEGRLGWWGELFLLYLLFQYGLYLLTEAIRYSHRDASNSPVIPEEELGHIEADVREGDVAEAIRAVRRIVPGTNFVAAREAIARIAARLEAQDRGRVFRSCKRPINWRALGICLGIEFLFLGIALFSLPRVRSVPFAWDVATGLAFYLGCIWMSCLDGLGRRMAAFVPALALQLTDQLLIKPRYPGFALVPEAYIAGIIFGGFIGICAFKRRASPGKPIVEQP